MSHHALGDQFAQHIADFRDRFHERGWHDPDYATGQCDTASVTFKAHLDRAGVPSAIHELDLDHDDEGYATNHFVNVVKHPSTGVEHVVDWTHRQFHEQADYPRVQTYQGYKDDLGAEEYHRGPDEQIKVDYPQYQGLHSDAWDTWEKPTRRH